MEKRFVIMSWVEELKRYEFAHDVDTWNEVKAYRLKKHSVVLDNLNNSLYDMENLPDHI